MKRRALIAATILAVSAPSAAAATKVKIMVAGRTGTLLAPRTVKLGGGSVKIGPRRCTIPAGTALAALLAARLSVRVTDAAGCDPASMFVVRIGPDANRGLGGWEYKIGRADPSFGAADPGGRLRSGAQLLWYWCVRADACQRTLAVTAQFAASGVQFHVQGYDDNGHGRSIAGATVHIGSRSAVTNAHGWATVSLSPGHYQVYATKAGLVRSFSSEVGVVR